MFFADLHCDTITKLEKTNGSLMKNDTAIDIERLKEYNSPIQTFAIWHDFAKEEKPFEKTKASIDFYYKQLEENKNYITHINNYTDFEKVYNSYKISSLLTVEGGDAIEGSIENLKELYTLGVRALTLTWNNNNAICSSCLTNSYGLTTFGFEVVRTMEKLKMIVDVSHMSTKGIANVANKSDVAIIASHSNCKSIVNQARNLNNYELHLLKERDALVGLNLYLPFLVHNPSKELKTEAFEYYICKHIDHLLKIVSEDNIAIGTDFDGGDYFYKKTKGVEDMNYIYMILVNKFGEIIAKKILGENVVSFLKKI